MFSTDFKTIRPWRVAGMMPRRAVTVTVLLVCAISLSGCMERLRDVYPPGPAVPAPGKAATQHGDGNAAAAEKDIPKPAAGTSAKEIKDAAPQSAAPCPADSGNTYGYLPGTGGKPAEGAGPSARTTFSYDGETITEDVRWSGRVTVRGSVTIAPQATVTVDPGTVVEFSRSSGRDNASLLLIRGRIAAAGTRDLPVKFLPKGNDANSATWQGIVFLASEKNNILEHCRIEGAETGVDADYSTVTLRDSFFSGCRAALKARGCRVRLSGCTVGNCDLGAGLYDSEAEIIGATLASNRSAVLAKRSSLYLADTIMADNSREALHAEDSSVKIVGSKFGDNENGLVLSSCEGLVSGNRIAKNRDCGISLTGSRVRVTGNDISQNGRIGIRVADGRGIAWGNIIAANGQYDLYNAGPDDFRAVGNWWGEGSGPDFTGKIHDRAAAQGIGKVLRYPALRDKPATAP